MNSNLELKNVILESKCGRKYRDSNSITLSMFFNHLPMYKKRRSLYRLVRYLDHPCSFYQKEIANHFKVVQNGGIRIKDYKFNPELCFGLNKEEYNRLRQDYQIDYQCLNTVYQMEKEQNTKFLYCYILSNLQSDTTIEILKSISKACEIVSNVTNATNLKILSIVLEPDYIFKRSYFKIRSVEQYLVETLVYIYYKNIPYNPDKYINELIDDIKNSNGQNNEHFELLIKSKNDYRGYIGDVSIKFWLNDNPNVAIPLACFDEDTRRRLINSSKKKKNKKKKNKKKKKRNY